MWSAEESSLFVIVVDASAFFYLKTGNTLLTRNLKCWCIVFVVVVDIRYFIDEKFDGKQ